MKLVKNKLRVLHYPQVLCEPFIVDVKDEIEAKKIQEVLAEQHLFLYDNSMIHDYSNMIMVVMWDENSDGEGNSDWVSYWNEDEMMEWEEFEETYLSKITVIEALVEKQYVLNINTILHTKDGGKIGNAIVTGREGCYWEITTDYGNKVTFTSEEIDEHFNIAWSNMSKEIDGYSCQEMQEMMSSSHKHRVAL